MNVKSKMRRKKLLLAALVGSVFSLSPQAQAEVGFSDTRPVQNNHKNGNLHLTESDEIDLNNNNGFQSIAPGESVEQHQLVSENFGDLFNERYVVPLNELNAANSEVRSLQEELSRAATEAERLEIQGRLDAAEIIQQSKQEAYDQAYSDDPTLYGKFYVPSNEAKQILGTKETVTSFNTTTTYVDPITGKHIKIDVKGDFIFNETGVAVSGNTSITYYEPTPDEDQYHDLNLVTVSGNDTTLVISGDYEKNDSNSLKAIAKESGLINLEDGADLDVDAFIEYYTGSGRDVSHQYKGDGTSSGSVSSEKVKWCGEITTVFGTYNIQNVDDANQYNRDLIEYIQNNLQFRLDHNEEEVQKFYNDHMSSLYTATDQKTLHYTYTWSEEDLAQIPEIPDDDIGLKGVDNNYLIGIKGSDSVINITENATIDSTTSSGTVIKGNFEDTGADGQNTINIDGKILGSAVSVDAKNTDINISETGKVGNMIKLANGNIDNKGSISNVSLTDGDIINHDGASSGGINITNGTVTNSENAVVRGSIYGTDATIDNSGKILGNIGATDSHIENSDDAFVGGNVAVSGSEFINEGIVNGEVRGQNSSVITNNNLIVGTNVIHVTKDSTITNGADSNIYIGYQHNGEKASSPTKLGKNSNAYIGIKVGDDSDPTTSKYINQGGNIYVSGTQEGIRVIDISNNGLYEDTSETTIILNPELDPLAPSNSSLGNDNKVFYIHNAQNPVTIHSNIIMNDMGSTGIYARQNSEVHYTGNMKLSAQNESGSPIANFGIWADGSYDEGGKRTAIYLESGTIQIDSDYGIGVHIRNGADVEINGDAEIRFSEDHIKQIGVLLSGNTTESNLRYVSSNDMQLKGEGSVLFRVERGATFHSNPEGPVKIYNSNDVDRSALFVVTNGSVATGASSKQSKLTVGNIKMIVSGEESAGIRVQGGGNAVLLDTVEIKVEGSKNTVASIDGKYYEITGEEVAGEKGSSLLTSSASLSNDNFSTNDSIGYYALNDGKLVHAGTIDFTKDGNGLIGVLLTDGGKLETLAGSKISVNGTAVKISGAKSQAVVKNNKDDDKPLVEATDGVAAYHVLDSANLLLSGNGITAARGTAHGILVDGASGIRLTDGAVLNLNDDSSQGHGIENKSNLKNIVLDDAKIEVKNGYGIHTGVGFQNVAAKGGVINVYGSGTGIRFENVADGGITNEEITFTKGENILVNVREKVGQGIYVNSSKNVTSSGSVNILSDEGKAALIVDGTSETVAQSGKLHSTSTVSEIVELNEYVSKFTNSGDILFGTFTDPTYDRPGFTGSYSDQIAVKQDQTTIEFTNKAGGSINGLVSLTAGDDTAGNIVNLEKSSVGHKFLTGVGNDVYNVTGITGSDADSTAKQFTKIDGASGDDVLNLIQSNYRVTKADTIKNIELINLKDSTTLTLDDVLPAETETFDIDSRSTLQYLIDDSKSFDRQVQNNGLFVVEGTADDLTFDFQNKQTDFSGTLELKNVAYDLDDINQESLENATLKGSADSTVYVGSGEQNVGNVHINTGTFVFGEVSPDRLNGLADNYISTDKLTIDGGTVVVDFDGAMLNPIPPEVVDNDRLNLMRQDDSDNYIQLIQANSVQKNAELNVVDQDGNEIVPTAKVDVIQQGEEVARATYGTTTATNVDNEQGLFIGFGLNQLELKGTGNNALRLDASLEPDDAPYSAREFIARITNYKNDDGSEIAGDLVISGNKEIVLNNSANDYDGKTIVRDGSALKTDSSHSLGNTAQLYLGGSSRFDLNGKEEGVGSFYGSENSVFNFNSGTFTLKGADLGHSFVRAARPISVSYGDLTGSGTLNLMDHDFYVFGENTGLSADVNNSGTSRIFLNKGGGLGTGNVSLLDQSCLVANFDTDEVFTHAFLAGDQTSTLEKNGRGILTFAQDQASYLGATELNEGAIVLTGGTAKTHEIRVAQGTRLVALDNMVIEGSVINQGNFYVGNNPYGTATTANSDTVTIENYVGGANSQLFFNGELEGDDSTINKLIITGDSQGESRVQVTNLGGRGAQTLNGIELIEVQGASDANFVRAGRIIAGAFDYDLVRGNQSGQKMNNWFLLSKPGASPEATGYYFNYVNIDDLVDLRLQDRLGSKEFPDYAKGEKGNVSSLWARALYTNKSQWDDSKTNKMKSHNNYIQVGYDFADWNKNKNRFQIGIMGGIYDGSGTVRSIFEDIPSTSTSSRIYSAGIYGTWYRNNSAKENTYVDTWVQYLWGTNELNSSDLNAKYDLDGMAVSAEIGYSGEISRSNSRRVFLEPKAQVIWNNVKQDSFSWSRLGGRINDEFKQQTSNAILTRVGLRVVSREYDLLDMNSNGKRNQLYLEANWLHSTKEYDYMVGQDRLSMGVKDKFEVKLGIEKQYNSSWSIWSYVFAQVGKNDYKNFGAQLGAKYSF